LGFLKKIYSSVTNNNRYEGSIKMKDALLKLSNEKKTLVLYRPHVSQKFYHELYEDDDISSAKGYELIHSKNKGISIILITYDIVNTAKDVHPFLKTYFPEHCQDIILMKLLGYPFRRWDTFNYLINNQKHFSSFDMYDEIIARMEGMEKSQKEMFRSEISDTKMPYLKIWEKENKINWQEYQKTL
jgi:hypothetical protein